MEINLLVVSAIVVGLVQVAKQFELAPKVQLTVVLLVAPLVVAVAAPLIGIEGWRSILITGVVVALQAMGMWSGGKTLIEKE